MRRAIVWRRRCCCWRLRRDRARCGPAAPAPGRARPPTTATCGTWSRATADAVADVDLAALRASPWSSALMQGRSRRRARGAAPALRLRRVHGGGAHGGRGDRSRRAGTNTLTIARGRFDAERVGERLRRRRTPGVARDAVAGAAHCGRRRGGRSRSSRRGRSCRATASACAAPIDAAWGVVADAGGGPLGELRRALDADRSPPAVTLRRHGHRRHARARRRGASPFPTGLRRVGGAAEPGRRPGPRWPGAVRRRRARGHGGVDLARRRAHLRAAADGDAARPARRCSTD